MQSLIKSSKELTEAELRKIRILFNMLKTSLQNGVEEKTKKVKSSKQKTDIMINDTDHGKKEPSRESNINKKEQRVKGPKRYVVFVGNLPVDIEKERVSTSFVIISELSSFFKLELGFELPL